MLQILLSWGLGLFATGKNPESGVPSVLLKLLIDALANQTERGIKFRLEIVTFIWSPNQIGNHSDSRSNDSRLDDVYGILLTMLVRSFSQHILPKENEKRKKNICCRVVMKYQYTSMYWFEPCCILRNLSLECESLLLVPLSDQTGDFDYEANQTSQCGPVAWGTVKYLQRHDNIGFITFSSSILLNTCAFHRLWLAKQRYTWFLNLLKEGSYLIKLYGPQTSPDIVTRYCYFELTRAPKKKTCELSFETMAHMFIEVILII